MLAPHPLREITRLRDAHENTLLVTAAHKLELDGLVREKIPWLWFNTTEHLPALP